MRYLRVAGIQLVLSKGNAETNRKKAESFILAAKQKGAELIVLPELFSSGYFVTSEIWDYAEHDDGPTVIWMKTLSGKYGIYLGAGLVEKNGKDFLNSFYLTTPSGTLAGKTHKDNGEAYVFRRGKGSYIIETDIGRIGVGICGDNQYYNVLRTMHNSSVDIMLMPHAWPTPFRSSGIVDEASVGQIHKRVRQLPMLYAGTLGIPVVFVNQTGPMNRMPGILGKIMTPDSFCLSGGSVIIDSKCNVVDEIGENEGVITGTVKLDQNIKRWFEPVRYGKNLFPGSFIARNVIIPIDILVGKTFYSLNRIRRLKARK
jgi:N-carbamoylputrescine amidase